MGSTVYILRILGEISPHPPPSSDTNDTKVYYVSSLTQHVGLRHTCLNSLGWYDRVGCYGTCHAINNTQISCVK